MILDSNLKLEENVRADEIKLIQVWVGPNDNVLKEKYLNNTRNFIHAILNSGYKCTPCIWTNKASLIVRAMAEADCLFLLKYIQIRSINELFVGELGGVGEDREFLRIAREEMSGGDFANYAAASDLIRILILEKELKELIAKKQKKALLYLDTDIKYKDPLLTKPYNAEKDKLLEQDINNFGVYVNTTNNSIIFIGAKNLNEAHDYFSNELKSKLLKNYNDVRGEPIIDKEKCLLKSFQEWRKQNEICSNHEFISTSYDAKRFPYVENVYSTRRLLTIEVSGPIIYFQKNYDYNKRIQHELINNDRNGFFSDFINHLGLNVKPLCDNTWLKSEYKLEIVNCENKGALKTLLKSEAQLKSKAQKSNIIFYLIYIKDERKWYVSAENRPIRPISGYLDNLGESYPTLKKINSKLEGKNFERFNNQIEETGDIKSELMSFLKETIKGQLIYSHDDNSDLINLPTNEVSGLRPFSDFTSLISPNPKTSKSWQYIVLQVPILPEVIEVGSYNTKIKDFKKIVFDSLLNFYDLDNKIGDKSELYEIIFKELKLIYNNKELENAATFSVLDNSNGISYVSCIISSLLLESLNSTLKKNDASLDIYKLMVGKIKHLSWWKKLFKITDFNPKLLTEANVLAKIIEKIPSGADLIIKELKKPGLFTGEDCYLTVEHLERFLNKIPEDKRKEAIEALQQGGAFEKVIYVIYNISKLPHPEIYKLCNCQPHEQMAKLLELTDFHESVIASLITKKLFEKLIQTDSDFETFMSHISQDKHSKIKSLLLKQKLPYLVLNELVAPLFSKDFKANLIKEELKVPDLFAEDCCYLTVEHLERFLDKIPGDKHKKAIELLQQSGAFEKIIYNISSVASCSNCELLKQMTKLLELTDFHDSVIASLINKKLFEKLIKKVDHLECFLNKILGENKRKEVIEVLQQDGVFARVISETYSNVRCNHTLLFEQMAELLKLTDFHDSVIINLEEIFEKLLKNDEDDDYNYDYKIFLSYIPQIKHSKIIDILPQNIRIKSYYKGLSDDDSTIIKWNVTLTPKSKISALKAKILETFIELKSEDFEEYKKYIPENFQSKDLTIEHLCLISEGRQLADDETLKSYISDSVISLVFREPPTPRNLSTPSNGKAQTFFSTGREKKEVKYKERDQNVIPQAGIPSTSISITQGI